MERTPFTKLTITDEHSFEHVGLYADLKAIAARDELSFLVVSQPATPRGKKRHAAPAPLGARTLLLNLLFWDAGTSDILTEPSLPADVVMHVVWHHLGALRIGRGGAADLFVESIASAFDVYLVGRLLGHRPDAEFLETQVPRMADAAADAGVPEAAFEAMLAEIAEAPEQAFESTRRLLFDASRALTRAASASEADDLLGRYEAEPFGPLLHHFEIATWVLRTRLDEARGGVDPRAVAEAARVDELLRAAPVSLDWLEARWVHAETGTENRS